MVDPVLIDISGWSRLKEVDAYANSRNISREEAIQELVNKGLSYLNHA